MSLGDDKKRADQLEALLDALLAKTPHPDVFVSEESFRAFLDGSRPPEGHPAISVSRQAFMDFLADTKPPEPLRQVIEHKPVDTAGEIPDPP